MNKDILRELLFGRISLGQGLPIQTDRYLKIEKDIEKGIEEIESKLENRGRKLLDNLLCLIQEKDGIEMEDTEYEHFMLGIIVGMEIEQYKHNGIN